MEQRFDNIAGNNPTNKTEKGEKFNLNIEICDPSKWKYYKEIKLKSIGNEPDAFCVSEKSRKRQNEQSDDEWKKELDDPDMISIIYKNGENPIGIAQAFLRMDE